MGVDGYGLAWVVWVCMDVSGYDWVCVGMGGYGRLGGGFGYGWVHGGYGCV